ncbi:MAG: Gfo/Idh/MocA family oxidoreductase [bacterium]|nr:Gfo/Idh/MocA family oxidoreductase [bacterium]
MARLRAGVIGAGSWAVASHIPNLVRRPDDVELVGVARPDRELLDWVCGEFGVEVAATDYRELLAHDLDICVVSSPNRFHYEHAKAAMESGAHVLVEKPFTVDPSEAWDLVETAERLDRHLLLALGWNYKPMVRRAKELVEEGGGFGEVEHIMIDMSSAARELLATARPYDAGSPVATARPETYTDPSISGGGYAQAQLSHALGMAFWLAEDVHPAGVFAFMSAPLQAPVELHDAISVRFSNGGVATVSGSSCHLGYDGNKHVMSVRIVGSAGMLSVDVGREMVYWYGNGGHEVRLDLDDHAGDYDCDGPVHALVDLALGTDVRNCSPGHVGARAVEVTEAAYRSARTGQLAHVGRV